MMLDDVCEAIVDCAHKTAPVDERGEYFAVGTPAMSGHRLNLGQARRISQSTFEQWTKRLRPRSGDLLLAREAPVGPVVMIPPEENVAPGQRTVLLRPDPAAVDSRFLYYCLTSARMQTELWVKAAGSTVPHLNVSDVRALAMPDLPSRTDQMAIAEVLGAFDNKIAANQIVAARGEELSAAIYEQTVPRVRTWAPLGSLATTVLGGTPARSNAEHWTGGTVPWLASGKANEERILEPTAWITEYALSTSAAKIMPRGATIIAITGATLGQVARLEIEASGNQSLVGVWHEVAAMNDWLHFAVRSEMPQLLRHSTGAAQQHVNKKSVDSLLVPLPGHDSLCAFGEQVRPLLSLSGQMDREAMILAKTRDELLPLLMSGKVRVKNAEKRVEEVV